MRTVDSSKYGKSRPKLTQDDLEADVAILTIASFDEIELDDDEQESGKRTSAVLTFQETGEKVLWLNKGQVDALVANLGNDADKWTGQRVPVEKVVASFGNKKFPKVSVVVDPAEWDKYLSPAKPKKKTVGKSKSKR